MPRLCRIDLKVLPQPGDEIVHRPRRGVRIQPPHIVQQLIPRQHHSLMLGEEPQQFHLERCQGPWLPPDPHLVSGEIDHAAGELERSSLPRPLEGPRPPNLRKSGQQTPHPRQQFRQLEWLRQILVRTQLKAPDPVLRQSPSRQDQHRHLHPLLAQSLQHRVSAHLRQHQVQDHQVE